MAWEKFEIRKVGTCKIRKKDSGEMIDASYERGILSTGKSRTFFGYQIILKIGAKTITGKSKGYSETYRLALADCNQQLETEGMKLLVAGNVASYNESPMSGGGGGGYVEGVRKAVDIMSFLDLG